MTKFNKTYLSLDNAEERGFIHRDYIAHCLRWTHVVKFLYSNSSYKSANILDVGCGREVPLAKMLYSSRLAPKLYVGVDVGSISPPQWLLDQKKFPLKLHEKLNFIEVGDLFKDLEFNLIICFEVLEHMEHDDGVRLLSTLKRHMTETTTCFISTPCYNGEKADNHVYEWRYGELKAELVNQGFKIINHWGTFASLKDYAESFRFNSEWWYLFNRLRGYYDTNYLATIFAPLFPEQSRNVLWEISI